MLIEFQLSFNLCVDRLQGTNYWIGLVYDEQSCVEPSVKKRQCWIWLDGTPMSAMSWDSQEPNNPTELCGKLENIAQTELKPWRNFQCVHKMPFICEVKGKKCSVYTCVHTIL